MGLRGCNLTGVSSYIAAMLLNENDQLTSSFILRLLTSGMTGLPALQRELIRAFFLDRIQAPKRYFKTKSRNVG